MSKRAPVLIDSHTHIVQEEDDVVRMFTVRVQEVSHHAEEHIRKGRG